MLELASAAMPPDDNPYHDNSYEDFFPADPDYPPREREIYERYAGSVAYISVETQSGDKATGTCFHIGEGLYLTAKHVIRQNGVDHKVLKIANTKAGVRSIPGGGHLKNYELWETEIYPKIFLHSDERYDIAVLRIDASYCPPIILAGIMADKFGNDLIMAPTVVMGFPQVFCSNDAVLVCAKGEVNAFIESYLHKQRMYIISCLARGGFSGGPVILPPFHCIGVVTDSLSNATLPAELGYMAVTGCLPIYELLDQNKIMPHHLVSSWRGYLAYREQW